MLTLSNVNKVYATRRKRKIYGLKDVNLSFPDKGLCLILGKSGCGKTTLLNILGGLDIEYEGDYVFMGKKLGKKDFSDFRKQYVNFVFQDFNLIDEYNVADNVALGGSLSQNDTGDVSSLLSKVGLDGYGKRYPKELSGGQQQRVAIARALLKDGRLLLADEPTGNLDRENSIEIYKLLKEISRDKLVIVVSHDEELARQYADYVIRLNKGTVVESNLEVGAEADGGYAVDKRRVLSNKEAFTMATREFLRNKPKIIMTVILMAVCFCVLSFAVIVAPLFKMSDVHYKLIKDQSYERFNLSEVTFDEYQQFNDRGYSSVVGDSEYVMLESKEQAERLGFKFANPDKVLPLTSNSYYVSDHTLRELIFPSSGRLPQNEAIIDGVKTRFTAGEIYDLVGQRIEYFGYDKICAGVIIYEQSIFDNEFKTYDKSFYGKTIYPILSNSGNNSNVKTYALYDGKSVDCGTLSTDFIQTKYEKSCVLTADGIKEFNYMQNISSSLSAKEVYLGIDAFNDVFQTRYDLDNLLRAEYDENTCSYRWMAERTPSELGKTISFQLSDGLELNGYTVCGILFSSNSDTCYKSYNEILFCENDLSARNALQLHLSEFSVWLKTDSVKNLKSLLATHNQNDSRCSIYSPVSNYETQLYKSFSMVRIISLTASVALVIATIIMTNLLISRQVIDQKRKIGIFKALGAKNRDIIRIYLYEMFLIAIPMVIFAVLSTLLVTTLFNNALVKEINPVFTLIYYQWVNVPITVVSVFTVIFAGIISPLRKITKLNVIEAIKNTAIK